MLTATRFKNKFWELCVVGSSPALSIDAQVAQSVEQKHFILKHLVMIVNFISEKEIII